MTGPLSTDGAGLVAREAVVREYDTVPPEKTGENPPKPYTLTAERVRRLGEGELKEKKRAAEEERSQRFRELYTMLDLRVVCHKDRSLEVTWGGDCSNLRGPTQVGATPRMKFRALIGPEAGSATKVSLWPHGTG